MDFELSENQKMLVQNLKEVLSKEFPKNYSSKFNEEEGWPWKIMKKLGELGYIALGVPVSEGGLGASSVDISLCIEEVARQMGGVATAYFTSVCFGARAISHFGSEKQRKWLLPGLMAGTTYVSLGSTEPDGGTDILALKTRANLDKDGNYIINGTKIFITGAHIAEAIITIARTSLFGERKARGISMFLVPIKTKGITVEKIELSMPDATGANYVYFENVVVPPETLFGELDKGIYQLFGILNDERIGAAAVALGLAQGAFDETLQYAKDRHAFGKPIGQFQAVHHALAESWIRIQAARNLVYEAAWRQANGMPCEKESAAAKYFASTTQIWVANECMDILGGYCATKDFFTPLAYSLRQTFAPITNNGAKNLVGERLGLPKSY